MEQQLTVVGAKSFNDTVDGNKYNNTKLFVMLPEKVVSSDARNVVGFNVVNMEFGTSEEFIKNGLAKIKYPCQAILDVEMTTKGYACNGFKLVPAKV